MRARSEVEAAWLVYEGKPATRLIAGGTDLMLQLRRGQRQALALIDLRRSGMDHILENEHAICIGATATVAALAQHPGIRAHFPALHTAAATLASQQIRNLATIGGNICNASPAADLVTPLLAYDAVLRVRRGDDVREVPVDRFFTGPGQHVLTQQDLLVEVVVSKPLPSEGERSRFLKLGFRGAQVIAVVNAAVSLRLRRGLVAETHIALGAVAPTAVRAISAERLLRGEKLTPEAIAAAAEAAVDDISPIDDVRSTAGYRRRVVRNFVRLALEEIAAQVAAETAHGSQRSRSRA
ncbi:MAG: FAD binding domain-containing protein [Deltaproteobacteria bacterium]|nr:FAD binding domain-containing protein [Deltaproteobacteria bacterium]